MSVKDAFSLAMMILGFICAALNYGTYILTSRDPDAFETKVYMFGVVSPLISFLLLAAACWLYCLIVG